MYSLVIKIALLVNKAVLDDINISAPRLIKPIVEVPTVEALIINYNADLPVTPLRVLTNKSDIKAVPYAPLRSLILLLSSLSFAFF